MEVEPIEVQVALSPYQEDISPISPCQEAREEVEESAEATAIRGTILSALADLTVSVRDGALIDSSAANRDGPRLDSLANG